MRYDLINNHHSHNLTQHEIFDVYIDIFNMREGQRVKHGLPILSGRDHRMVFIFSDRTNLTPSVIMHVPFLHERKLYLNR